MCIYIYICYTVLVMRNPQHSIGNDEKAPILDP